METYVMENKWIREAVKYQNEADFLKSLLDALADNVENCSWCDGDPKTTAIVDQYKAWRDR